MKVMKKEFWIPSLLHFFVDFFSVYVVVSFKSLTISPEGLALLTIGYDALAFLPQPVLGAIFEKNKNLKYLGAIGCLFVMLGALIPEAITAIILLGLGNALFHVCDGTVILEKSKKAAPLGVFISFGSLGLGLALSFANSYMFFILLGLFVLLTVFSCFLRYEKIDFLFVSEKGKEKSLVIPLIFIVLGVFLRGFFGPYNNNTWTSSATYPALLTAIAVFIGKFSGGFALDFIGGLPLIVVSGVLSFVCVFFPSLASVSLLGVIGVNLLMALTMEFVRRAMPGHLGFGFGLLASFLFVGYIFGFSLKSLLPFQSYLAPILMVLNTATLLYCSWALKKEARMDFFPRKEQINEHS